MSTETFPNLQIAQKHIKAVTGSIDTEIYLRFIHDSDKKAPAQKLIGTIAHLWPRIQEAQSKGYGIYFVVNEGGDNDKEITNIRSLYIDADNTPFPSEWHKIPDFIVRRDDTHWHSYWACSEKNVENFKENQTRLFTFYKTDPQVINPSRVMRLAGSLHLKDPQNPKAITFEPLRDTWEEKRSQEEIVAGLPEVETKTSEHAKASDDRLDLKENVSRAAKLLQNYVSQNDVAVEGAEGDNRTFQLFCEVQNLGISKEKSLALIENIWNPHCLPPWSHEELGVKSENAANYAQNEVGSWAVTPAQETFSTTLSKLRAENPAPDRSKFYFEDDEEQDMAPDPVWMIPQLIPDNATVLIVGKTGSFKSFLAEDIALAIAADKKTFGEYPIRPGPTFYGSHEGRNEIKKARKRAWKAAREVEARIPFYVARAPQVASNEQCEDFREQIRVRLRKSTKKIGTIILDTVAKCMVGLNENDARDCGIFIAFCDSLRDEFACPVIALHHFGKDDTKGGRGNSALPAGFDTVIHIRRTDKTKSVEVIVEQHKDADERKEPWTFEGRSIRQSLVFFETTQAEHKILTGQNEDLTRKKVVQEIKVLKANSLATGVTTFVLASQLMPSIQGQDEETHQSLLEKTVRVLKKRSRSDLSDLCERTGRDVIWFL